MPEYKFKRKDILRPEEVQELIDNLGDPKDKGLVALMYLFGARPCEIFDVQTKDIYVEDEKLYIRFRTRKKKRRSDMIITTRKPFCFISDRFTKYIIDYIRGRDSEEYVFRTGNTEASQTVIINRRLKAHNPAICQYLFRHSRNTLIAENGGTESQLVVWNGWADGRPAKHYVHATQKLMDSVPTPESK